MVGGTEVRTSSSSSSQRSTAAAGPSGRRPNSVNSRASCSSRSDSAVSTSIASWVAGDEVRASWATASRIGVSGFRISCATRRAVSRNARSRSASISCARPCSIADRHLPQRGAERGELRRAAAGKVRRKRLHPPDVTGPADQLLDRPAQLAGEVTTQPNRGVEGRRAQQKDREPQAGVVVAAVGLGALELADGAVERGRVRRERRLLLGAQIGGVDGPEQDPAGGAHLFQGLPGSHRRRGGADRQTPADDRRGRRHRAEADQDEEYALVEGEPHRP